MFACVTYSGIQLLEHEEVLLNCYEKVNVQEAAINKGNMGLETLEKEKRDLQLEINEEKRQIDLMKKEGPLMKSLEKDIATLQIEVGEVNQHKLKHILTQTLVFEHLNFLSVYLLLTKKTWTKEVNPLNLKNCTLITWKPCGWRKICVYLKIVEDGL